MVDKTMLFTYNPFVNKSVLRRMFTVYFLYASLGLVFIGGLSLITPVLLQRIGKPIAGSPQAMLLGNIDGHLPAVKREVIIPDSAQVIEWRNKLRFAKYSSS